MRQKSVLVAGAKPQIGYLPEGSVIEQKVGDIYFFSFPLQEESRRMIILAMPHYKDALKKDITRLYFNELRLRAITRQNQVQVCSGLQGGGKSFSQLFIAQKLGNFLGNPLTLDHVGFTITEVLKIAEEAPVGSIVFNDEQIAYHGEGSKIEKDALKNNVRVIRQRKIFFFFLSPDEVIRHPYHYLFEVWRAGSSKPYDYSKTFEEQWEFTQSIVFNEKQIGLGFVITGTPEDEEFLAAYEKKKEAFIKGVIAQRGSGRKAYLRELVFNCLYDDPDFFRKIVSAKNKNVKANLLDEKVDITLSVAEMGKLVSHMDYLIDTDEGFIDRRDILLKSEKKNMRKRRS